MRTTNKLKIVIIVILAYIACMLTPIALNAQGGPGGPPPGMGGPPSPPAGYCAQNPTDPACQQWGDTTVPIGDWKWQLGLMLIGSIYVFYKFKKDKEYGIE